MGTKEKHIAIYSRKSKFTGKGESIENQIELCRRYISVHDGDRAAESSFVYEDEGFSGGNLERPQFKKMIEDAKEGLISAIIVYRLDRISRNIGDFANLIKELNDMEISFVSIKEQFDTTSPMGRAMMYIASVFSQLERETIAERIRDNMHELSKTGRWLGGTTPTGYSSEAVEKVMLNGKVRKAYKLKIIPEEAELIRIIFAKFLETNSLTKTDAFLLQNGYATKNGKTFTRFAIKGILSNPVYVAADHDMYDFFRKKEVELFSEESDFTGQYGIMAYNRTLEKAGKANQIRPMNEWIVSVGRHPGIVTGAMWINVQTRLENNRSRAYRKPRSNVALLSGLLYCGNCGDYMRPKLSKRLNTAGEQIYSYVCTMKERSHLQRCNICNANGNTIDQAIMNEIKKLSADNGEFMHQLELGKKALVGNCDKNDEQIEKQKELFAENEKEIKALVSSLRKASGSIAEQYIMHQIDELHSKGELIRQRIEEVQQLAASHTLSDIEFDLYRQLLSSFGDTIDRMTVEQRRAAVRTCVKKIVWDGKGVHLYLFCCDDDYDFPNHPAGDKDSSHSGDEGDEEPLCVNSK